MKNEYRVGPGPFFLLFLVLLTLKLTGHISWSWWLVTLPLWWPFGLVLVIMGVCIIVAALSMLTVQLNDPVKDTIHKLKNRK